MAQVTPRMVEEFAFFLTKITPDLESKGVKVFGTAIGVNEKGIVRATITISEHKPVSTRRDFFSETTEKNSASFSDVLKSLDEIIRIDLQGRYS